MSALASLARAYERMADRGEVPAAGYSTEKIGYCIVLKPDGTPAFDPVDLRHRDGKILQPRMMSVPASFKRPGVTPRAFFLWDNTAFALGIAKLDGKDAGARLEAFRERHRRDLTGVEDEGLVALLRFIDAWTPDKFEALGWPDEMRGENVVFALEAEYRDRMIHDRPAARELWTKLSAGGKADEAACLVTGERAPIARLHPAIKGVWGAQTAGASIVSFNLDAFTSYGHEQGDNAPVSEHVAFAYTTALNKYLEKGSLNRVQIGDASTVFWADASEPNQAHKAEILAGAMLGIDERGQEDEIAPVLEKIREGRPLSDADVAPELASGVRFHILGLSPNAARLSARFYLESSFDRIAKNFQRHLKAMHIEPPPRDANPSLWRCLIETASQRKSENIPPQLAGDWLRAILAGTPYPLTLLATLLMRLRADKNVNALRVAMLKSVLVRNFGMEKTPVSLDLKCPQPGYLLGRLFATYEQVQSAALGGVNAGVRDKFYGSASSMPRKVFKILDSNSANHLSKLGKTSPGYRVMLEKQIAAIMEMMSPDDDPFPAQLPEKQQALFPLGYYHQRNFFFRGRDKTVPGAATEETSE